MIHTTRQAAKAARFRFAAAVSTLFAFGAPLGAICYEDPFPACPNNDAAKSVLLEGADFPAGDDGRPMAFVDPADGSPRRFVPLQGGRIRVWTGGASFRATDFLDLSSDVRCCGERGLLALAFHPDYVSNGFFYVMYTSEGTAAPGELGDVVVARYTRSAANAHVADPGSEHVVLIVARTTTVSNHNGGALAFGPDGFLYVSTGDGGNGCDDPVHDAQDPDSVQGKILRLDVDGDDFPADANRNYAIPAGNPFADAGGAPEVWALGLRNPFRFTFDRSNGDIFVGDVGQSNWEEINHLPATAEAPMNFGWVCREGCNPASDASSSCNFDGGECSSHTGTTCQYPTASGLTDPNLCFSNPDGWESIIAGYRYRGVMVPEFANRFFFVDVNQGQIWRTPANDLFSASCWDAGNSGAFAFGEDHLGELYLVNGGAKRIECLHGGNPDGCYWASWGGIFEDGFESQDTSHWSSSVPPL